MAFTRLSLVRGSIPSVGKADRHAVLCRKECCGGKQLQLLIGKVEMGKANRHAM